MSLKCTFYSFRHWILSAIPAIGSPVTIRFIKEKFIAGDLTTPEAAQALMAAVHMVTADLDSVKLVEVGKPSSQH